jgi:uncharacterized membrane protein YccC
MGLKANLTTHLRECFLSQTLKVFFANQSQILQESAVKSSFSLAKETFRVFATELRNTLLRAPSRHLRRTPHRPRSGASGSAVRFSQKNLIEQQNLRDGAQRHLLYSLNKSIGCVSFQLKQPSRRFEKRQKSSRKPSGRSILQLI